MRNSAQYFTLRYVTTRTYFFYHVGTINFQIIVFFRYSLKKILLLGFYINLLSKDYKYPFIIILFFIYRSMQFAWCTRPGVSEVFQSVVWKFVHANQTKNENILNIQNVLYIDRNPSFNFVTFVTWKKFISWKVGYLFNIYVGFRVIG